MTKTILVVEDDKSVSRMLHDVLESEGFEVSSERDGEWGLRAFQEKAIDLLIIDVLIPKIKGFDLIARIRELEKGRTVPIIVISGVYRSTMHQERIIEKHRVAAYLDKPVDIDRLIDVLHDVFSSAYPEPRSGNVRARGSSTAASAFAANGRDPSGEGSKPVMPAPSSEEASTGSSPAPASAAAEGSSASSAAGSVGSAREGSGVLDAGSGSSPPSAAGSKKGGATPSLLERLNVPSQLPTPQRASTSLSLPPVSVQHRGDLRDVPFARLFGGLFAARATGALLLRKGSVKKIVYLRQGVPVFVKSNLLNECLGRIMVAERLITQDECDRSLALKRTSSKKQGEILVEMGSISPHNLEFALEIQMQAKLFDVFSWMEGKFQFTFQEDYDGPQVAVSLSPSAMIYEGASRTMSPERIRRELARIDDAIVIPSNDPTFRYQAIELDPRSARLLDRIDGKRSVQVLLDDAGFDADDAATLLYSLSCTYLMRVIEPETKSAPNGREAAEEFIPMVLDDADLELLSTDEIHTAAQAARLGQEPALEPRPAPAPEVSVEGRAEREVPPPAPAALRVTTSAPAEAAGRGPSTAEPSQTSSDGVVAQPAPEPRSEAGAESSPQLSNEIRRQVRARLEAEAMRIASEASSRPVAAASSAPKKATSRPAPAVTRIQPPRPDTERDARMARELAERLARIGRQSHYEVLGVHRRAAKAEIEAAYERLARDQHPDRVVPGTTLRECRSAAERIYLAIRRAFDVLSEEDTRRPYDRELGEEVEEGHVSPIVMAEAAFERGRSEAARGEWSLALELFRDATELNPTEGLYSAYLGWAMFSSSSKDEDARQLALTAFDRAAELSPRSEELYLLRGTLHQRAGNRAEAIRDFEAALRCNKDSLSALKALKALEPAPVRKAGFLSRLTTGGGSGS